MLCQLRLNGQDLRLAQRRAAERTDDFKTDYRMRGGIEATNSMLKRVAGLNRLRVRGRLAVFSQHSAESRRLEFTASGQCAITDRQTDERWKGWGFCVYVSRNFRALARSHIASKRLPALHSCLTDSNPKLRQIPTSKHRLLSLVSHWVQRTFAVRGRVVNAEYRKDDRHGGSGRGE